MQNIILKVGFLESAYYSFLNHFEASYTRRILKESLLLLDDLWPFLVVGIVLTSAVKLFVSKEQMAAFIKKNGHASILIATLVGIASPLGSYVVIPLSAALFIIGVPLPPLMALVIASPLINPNLFFLTAGAFGFELALMRVFSAFLLGLSAGYFTRYLINKSYLSTQTIVTEKGVSRISEFTQQAPVISFKVFINDLYRMTRYVSKYFFIAIVIAAGIKILVAPSALIRLVDGNQFLSVVLTTGAGVPFYICGGAAIPVVQQLAELGLSKGAVLAFFISGPATKLSSLYIIQSVYRTSVLGIYLGVGIIGALLIGLLYNLC